MTRDPNKQKTVALRARHFPLKVSAAPQDHPHQNIDHEARSVGRPTERGVFAPMSS